MNLALQFGFVDDVGAARDGRSHCGERNGAARLSEVDVKNIRAIYKYTSATQQELADIYLVTKSTISRITRGDRWKHI